MLQNRLTYFVYWSEIQAKVVDFNGEEKKISLSMKALEAPAEESAEEFVEE